MNIVEQSEMGVTTDSHLVARKFGMRHAKVMEVIRAMFVDYPVLKVCHSKDPSPGPKWAEAEREYRGQTFTVILMNREFFALLGGRFRTERAREWQWTFITAFFAMEDRLIQLERNKKSEEWQGLRSHSKLYRREYTDAVQEFVDYATEQGSKNAKHYYSNMTKATYKALGMVGQVRPAIRDALNGMELWQLQVTEDTARKALKKYMKQGEHYKVIYQLVKTDVEALAAAMMIEKPKELE